MISGLTGLIDYAVIIAQAWNVEQKLSEKETSTHAVEKKLSSPDNY